MRLSRRFDRVLVGLAVISLALVFGCVIKANSLFTYAEGEDEAFVETDAKFVTFYDGGEKLIVKTEAKTVGDAISRAGITLNSGDIVDPVVETEINADNFFVNIGGFSESGIP